MGEGENYRTFTTCGQRKKKGIRNFSAFVSHLSLRYIDGEEAAKAVTERGNCLFFRKKTVPFFGKEKPMHYRKGSPWGGPISAP